jgi:hypothetical protein
MPLSPRECGVPRKLFREQAREGELRDGQNNWKEKVSYEKSKYNIGSDPVGDGLLCIFPANASSL